MAVVVPAHNEERLLPGCLASIRAACGGYAVSVFVVADACTDATAAVASECGARVVRTDRRNVGAARFAGFAAALAVGAEWIATTDADSRVPPDWLDRQLVHVAAGADAVVGTVRVSEWADWPPWLPPMYELEYARHHAGLGHRHVHGANLGVTAAAYRAVGGFAPRRDGEDVALVRALWACGRRIAWATDLPVLTSSRAVGRVEAGFSGHLRILAADQSGGGPPGPRPPEDATIW
jgi:glycosyltransferase involved in cell wall biosynthesis